MLLELIRHLLDPAYLYALGPMAADSRVPWGYVGVLAVVTLGAALWLARSHRHRRSSLAPWSTLACAGLGWAALGAQRYGTGPLSARVWTLTATVAAVAVPLLSWFSCLRWPSALSRYVQALGCSLTPDDPPAGRRATVIALSLHVALLAGCIRARSGAFGISLREAAAFPLAAGIVAAVCLALAGLSDAPRRRLALRPEVLAPLLVPYVATVCALFAAAVLHLDLAAYGAFAYPDLLSPLLDPSIAWWIAIAWMLLTTGSLVSESRPARLRWGLGIAVAVGAAWLAALFVRHLSYGAGGSDPLGYLQMAADLARTGDPRHSFPLATLGLEEGVALWPFVPAGYNLPLGGLVATVWPAGWPALLTPLYLLGGERLALWGAPLALIASAIVTWLLGREMTVEREAPGAPWREALPLLAPAILLTSYEVLSRSLVPMADAAAALFTTLMLYALIRARRRDSLWSSAGAGLALALAYDVRHPLLVLACAAVPALLLAPWPLRRRAQHLIVFGCASLAGALPDLWYHAVSFGSPWTTESSEWFLLSAGNIPATLADLWHGDLLRRNEWGFLWPMVALGIASAVRDRRTRGSTLTLLVGAAAVHIFHLCYAALRLRDLIAIFPLLALWAAAGVQALWSVVRTRPHSLWRAAAIGLTLTLLLARTGGTLTLPLDADVATYGYLTEAQVQGYAKLGAALPQQAVIAAGASAGAVMRYAEREIVRPSTWGPEEFARVMSALEAQDRPLYLLDDGTEMRDWLSTLPGQYEVIDLGELALPRYGSGDQPVDGMVQLYVLSEH